MKSFKPAYRLSEMTYQNTMDYHDVTFRLILFRKCVEEGIDPAIHKADKWKKVGSNLYGWFTTNDCLDTNAPPHIRHDFFKSTEGRRADLVASILETKDDTPVYHVYEYKDEMLVKITETDDIEAAKSTIEVLAVME